LPVSSLGAASSPAESPEGEPSRAPSGLYAKPGTESAEPASSTTQEDKAVRASSPMQDDEAMMVVERHRIAEIISEALENMHLSGELDRFTSQLFDRLSSMDDRTLDKVIEEVHEVYNDNRREFEALFTKQAYLIPLQVIYGLMHYLSLEEYSELSTDITTDQAFASYNSDMKFDLSGGNLIWEVEFSPQVFDHLFILQKSGRYKSNAEAMHELISEPVMKILQIVRNQNLNQPQHQQIYLGLMSIFIEAIPNSIDAYLKRVESGERVDENLVLKVEIDEDDVHYTLRITDNAYPQSISEGTEEKRRNILEGRKRFGKMGNGLQNNVTTGRIYVEPFSSHRLFDREDGKGTVLEVDFTKSGVDVQPDDNHRESLLRMVTTIKIAQGITDEQVMAMFPQVKEALQRINAAQSGSSPLENTNAVLLQAASDEKPAASPVLLDYGEIDLNTQAIVGDGSASPVTTQIRWVLGTIRDWSASIIPIFEKSELPILMMRNQVNAFETRKILSRVFLKIKNSRADLVLPETLDDFNALLDSIEERVREASLEVFYHMNDYHTFWQGLEGDIAALTNRIGERYELINSIEDADLKSLDRVTKSAAYRAVERVGKEAGFDRLIELKRSALFQERFELLTTDFLEHVDRAQSIAEVDQISERPEYRPVIKAGDPKVTDALIFKKDLLGALAGQPVIVIGGKQLRDMRTPMISQVNTNAISANESTFRVIFQNFSGQGPDSFIEAFNVGVDSASYASDQVRNKIGAVHTNLSIKHELVIGNKIGDDQYFESDLVVTVVSSPVSDVVAATSPLAESSEGLSNVRRGTLDVARAALETIDYEARKRNVEAAFKDSPFYLEGDYLLAHLYFMFFLIQISGEETIPTRLEFVALRNIGEGAVYDLFDRVSYTAYDILGRNQPKV